MLIAKSANYVVSYIVRGTVKVVSVFDEMKTKMVVFPWGLIVLFCFL